MQTFLFLNTLYAHHTFTKFLFIVVAMKFCFKTDVLKFWDRIEPDMGQARKPAHLAHGHGHAQHQS